jgi:hypothetical protein
MVKKASLDDTKKDSSAITSEVLPGMPTNAPPGLVKDDSLEIAKKLRLILQKRLRS